MDLESRLREEPLKIRDVWSADKTAALRAGVLRLRRRRSLTRAGLALGAGLCAALVGSAWLRDGATPAPLEPARKTAVLAPVAPASSTPEALIWSDGSRAEPLDRESVLMVSRDRPEQVTVVLQRGGARFGVTPNARRRFEVESGPVLVRVQGTTFSVTRTDAGARVVVEDGHVQVFWAGEKTDLFAGDAGTFPRRQLAPELRAPEWRDLAKRGEYRRAYTALRQARTHVSDLPEDHMLAADVARLSGHPEQAVVHLRAVSERFADDPRAPVAAFTLGRILQQELERPGEAARAFRRARTLWPRGPLALDAWAGEAEALRDAGDARAAGALAARYIEQHPKGRHAPAMRSLSHLH